MRVTLHPSALLRMEPAQRASEHGLLWRIEKNGHTSWLYGTLHVARADWMLPGPAVRSALQQVDSIALELDLLDKGTRRQFVKASATLIGLLPQT